MDMEKYLPRLVKPPAMSLDEIKAYSTNLMGHCNPVIRKGRFDFLEVCGQSESIRNGFAKLSMESVAFDCRVSV